MKCESIREQREQIKWANRASKALVEKEHQEGRTLVEELLTVFGGDPVEPAWEDCRVARQRFGCELLAMLIRGSGERHFLMRFVSRASGRTVQ